MNRSSTPNMAGRQVLAHRRLSVLAAACLLGMLASPLLAQLPTTQLSSVYPPGGKQGTEVDVTVAGAVLDDVDRLVFSHPGIKAEQKNDEHEFLGTRPVANQFTVTIAADVAPGIYEVRAVGRFGASNPRTFVVGADEEVMDNGANRSRESAQELEVGQVVNGRADASNVDYYKLALKQGQRVLIDCLAERIDSRMDATLVCYDAAGDQLAMVRDTVGLDAMLDFTAPAEGEYIIGVHDFLYDGGAEHFYRLSVHDGPHIDFVMPPAALPGSSTEFTIYGRNLPKGKPVEGVTVDGVPLEQTTVTIQLPKDDASRQMAPVGDLLPPHAIFLEGIEYQLDSSNPVRIGFATAPVIIENGTNNEPASAQTVAVPCEIAGQFYPARDTDWYQFEAKKGDVYWIDVLSHQLGVESDPYMVIQLVTKNDEGEETVKDIAQVDDPPTRNAKIGTDFDVSTDDPSYRLVVNEDGLYRIGVRDQFGSARNDPRLVYRLVIRPEQPDFRLIAYPEQTKVANANQTMQFSVALRKGGTTMIKTLLDRRDNFAGEVEIEVEGLPPGVSCAGAILAGPADTAWLILSADEDASDWVGTIRIVAKSEIDGKPVVRYARTGTCVWGTANRTQAAPSFRVTRDIELSVCGEVAQAFVKAGDTEVIETSRGGKIEVPVEVTRRGDFKADLKLVATGLPAEIKPGDVDVKGSDGKGKMELVVNNAQAKPGTYTFYLRADAQIKYQRNPEAVQRAEEDQKLLVETVKTMGEAVTQSTKDRDAANKAAQEAEAAMKQAEQEKTKAAAAVNAADDESKDAVQSALAEAEKALEEAKSQVEEAKKTQQEAEAALKEAQDRQKRATDAKTAADKVLDDAKKANAAANLNVDILSTPIKLRVVEAPFDLEPASATVKQGEKVELPVNVVKKYGFDEAVEVTLEVPNAVKGLKADKSTIAKGKDSGNLEITAANDATAGDHTLTVQIKAKFNNVDVTAAQPLTLKVEPAEPKE